MAANKKIKLSYKEILKISLKKGQEKHLYVLLYRIIAVPFVKLFLNFNISPNMITIFSGILALIAAMFYLKADYIFLIIGTIILNLSEVLDFVDGYLARYRKSTSKFGAWFDCVVGRIGEYAIFVGLTLGLYLKTNNPIFLILGIFALTNSMMISNIRSFTRLHLKPKQKHEVKFGKRFYLGGEDTFTVLVTITTLLNKVHYLLWIYAILGVIIWIRQIYRVVVNYRFQ